MAEGALTEREEWSEQLVEGLLDAHRQDRGPLMPILRELQGRCGYVDRRSVPLLAEGLNLSQAEVFGVISFYKDFRAQPSGSHAVLICRAEACQSVGAEALAAHARARLGIEFGQTTGDDQVSLDQVFCLGNCALGPSVMVDGSTYGRVDAASFDVLVGS
jgi:formate dehydrogenase subunit gamma